jgi:hypothetical protein
MNVTREPPEPRAADSRPDDGADKRDRDAEENEGLSELRHA